MSYTIRAGRPRLLPAPRPPLPTAPFAVWTPRAEDLVPASLVAAVAGAMSAAGPALDQPLVVHCVHGVSHRLSIQVPGLRVHIALRHELVYQHLLPRRRV